MLSLLKVNCNYLVFQAITTVNFIFTQFLYDFFIKQFQISFFFYQDSVKVETIASKYFSKGFNFSIFKVELKGDLKENLKKNQALIKRKDMKNSLKFTNSGLLNPIECYHCNYLIVPSRCLLKCTNSGLFLKSQAVVYTFSI